MSERPVGGAANLPPDVPPEYAEEYLRGYERAYAEAAGLASAEQDEPPDTVEQEAVDPHDDPDDDTDDTADDGDAEEAPVVPGFVLWEGRDERYDEPPDVEGSPRWVMPFLAVCVIVLLFVAVYLLA